MNRRLCVLSLAGVIACEGVVQKELHPSQDLSEEQGPDQGIHILQNSMMKSKKPSEIGPAPIHSTG
ncbi:hypothetical protein [Pajaroellobacter abortibovis]|uniref:Uncharacterized protein n=1 Tax=Pajaroellobacter abortibovis TaxID=1882918 RepID=A0A1L6MWL4_9BACT|nr:hypothetical protein [Pajaroellobacter abortibovis]APR99911.1 hypothetical protein BCY86_03860 [Pajaroellobacter abortibovis]